MRVLPLCVVVALVFGVPGRASAELPPELDADAMRAVLAEDARWVPWWYWGWSGTFAATGTVQLVLEGLADTPGDRAEHAVGAVSAWVGVVGGAIGPMNPEVLVPDSGDPRVLLRALREQARREAAATSWIPHVVGAALTTAGGLYLWLGEDRPLEGGLHIGLGILVGEVQIWTVPTASLDWWTEAFPDEDP